MNLNQHNFYKKWNLVAYKNYSKEELMQKKGSMSISKSENNVIASANMGCNTLNFPVKIDNSGTIKFSQGISTMMACDNMQLEMDFVNDISEMINYKLDGHYLILSDGKNKEMKFLAEDWD
jgi:heat shock protein HslJ